MLSAESVAAIQAIVDARKAAGTEPDRTLRGMTIITAVGEFDCNPTKENVGKLVMRVLALAAAQGVDLNEAIAAATAKWGKPLPE